jgi:hypothetical protein
VPGDPATHLRELAARLEAEPASLAKSRAAGDALAEQAGPMDDAALAWRIAVVRALIANPPDGDAVREAYGELVDRYRDDKTALAKVKPLGDEIRQRESEGSLPSVLVARSDRRPKTHNG